MLTDGQLTTTTNQARLAPAVNLSEFNVSGVAKQVQTTRPLVPSTTEPYGR